MMYDNGAMYGWMMTGSWSVTHLLFFAIMVAVVLYPVGLILRYLGYSPFWAVLACVPVANLIGLWVVAFGLGSSNADRMKAVDPHSGR
jgi:uncharacterized membrane protein